MYVFCHTIYKKKKEKFCQFYFKKWLFNCVLIMFNLNVMVKVIFCEWHVVLSQLDIMCRH